MSWVFGPGGGSTTTPGGADKDIQFNNNGSLSGSNLLTTDGSGSLSASVHVSASTFYGDGSNLTGLTASAVNVADGPEFSFQFRRDIPVTGEISGSGNFSVSPDLTKLSVTGTLIVSGAAAANIEGPVIITSPEGKLEVQDTTNNYQVTLIPAVIPRVAFGTISDEDQYMVIDGGATNRIITNNDFFIATSSTYTQGLYYDVSLERIGVNTSTPTHTFAVSGDAAVTGTLNITSDAIVEGQVKVGPGTGVGYVASNGDPDTRIRFGAAGRGSDSISIEAGGKSFIILDENGRDELILGAVSSDIVHVSGSLTASVGMRVSASAANGQDIFVGSGTTRTIGALIHGSDDFFVIGQDNGKITLSSSSGIEFVTDASEGVGSFGSPIKVFDDQDGTNTVVELSNNGVVSGSSKGEFLSLDINSTSVITSARAATFTTAKVSDLTDGRVVTAGTAGELEDSDNFTYNDDGLGGGKFLQIRSKGPGANNFTGIMAKTASISVLNAAEDGLLAYLGYDGTISASSNLSIAGTSALQGNVTAKGSLSVEGNTTLGNASGDSITIKAGSITQTDNALTYLLKDSQDGLSGNGALLFFTGSGGDFMKFHTNGSGKGVVFSQEVYVTNKTNTGAFALYGTNGKLNEVSGLIYDGGSSTLQVPGSISGSGDLTAKSNITFGVSEEKTANFNIRDFRTMIVDTRASVVTGTLPGVTSHANIGLTYTVKDVAGSGSTNNVVIAASGSQKIDGASEAKIQTNYGALTVTAFSSSRGGFGWGIVSTT